MKANTYKHLSLITAITLTAPLSAYAQNIAYQDQSVTVYELEPNTYNAPLNAPTRSNNSAPLIPDRSYMSEQTTNNSTQYNASTYQAPAEQITPITPVVAMPSADETITPDTEPTPDTGWLGAVWSGRANIGASLQTGNTEQDAINGDASVKAKWLDANQDTKHRASIKAEINRETQSDVTTEDNRFIQGAYDYFLNKKWFLNSTLGFEQDDIDMIDLRTTAGFGLGHQVYESDDLNLQYVFGPSYLHEKFDSGDTDSSVAARWALDYDQKFWDGMIQAFHDHELYVPVDDTAAFLIDTKTGLRIPLKKGLVVSGEVDFDWDNDPAPGTKEDDTTYAVKVGYEW